MTLPADGVAGNITGDDVEAVVPNVCRSESLTCEAEIRAGTLMDAEQVNQSRYYLLPNSFTWMETRVLNIPVLSNCRHGVMAQVDFWLAAIICH